MIERHELVDHLGLQSHPEGGWYRRVWTGERPPEGGRAQCSVTRYLMTEGDRSAWHRLDATEVWFHHTGSSLRMELSADGVRIESQTLSSAQELGDYPSVSVPAGNWQSAECVGEFALVSVMVVPEFVWEGFEMAPEGWTPG